MIQTSRPSLQMILLLTLWRMHKQLTTLRLSQRPKSMRTLSSKDQKSINSSMTSNSLKFNSKMPGRENQNLTWDFSLRTKLPLLAKAMQIVQLLKKRFSYWPQTMPPKLSKKTYVKSKSMKRISPLRVRPTAFFLTLSLISKKRINQKWKRPKELRQKLRMPMLPPKIDRGRHKKSLTASIMNAR